MIYRSWMNDEYDCLANPASLLPLRHADYPLSCPVCAGSAKPAAAVFARDFIIASLSSRSGNTAAGDEQIVAAPWPSRAAQARRSSTGVFV